MEPGSYKGALPAASKFCRGCVAATMEPKCELIQLLLPDQRRERSRHRCFNVGTCELRRSSITEFQWLRRCHDGHGGKCALGWSGDDGKREQRAPADLSAAAHVSSLGSTMTGPACSARSSSGAPVCASLVRAASTKTSPLMHARVADNHQRSRQRLHPRPPHPRGLGPHRRLGSMSPVSPGRHYRMRTKCLASEGCVPKGCNFGAAYPGTSPRVSLPAQTLDSLFA